MSTTVPDINQPKLQIPAKHLISRDEYRKMYLAGIFEPNARVELIEGEIFDMTPIGSKHASVVTRLTEIFSVGVRGKAILTVQNPISLGVQSEPQPDLAVLKPSKDYYAAAHPGPEDILLIIEVADTTATYDREIKVPLYARHGIREVWLMDLERQRTEVYHGPQAGEFRHVDHYRKETVAPKEFPDLKVNLNKLVLD